MSKNKQNILIVFFDKYKLLIAFILLVIFQIWIASGRLYIYHFVDEDHHIVNAYMMTQGKSIYQDLSSNHQPLPFIFSYFLQKFLPINNLLNLIKFHHLFILMYGIGWYFILVRKFKYKAIAFGFLFEAIKYLFFGNLFLAETFAVYPLVYLGFLFFHNNLKINFDNIFDKFIFSVSFILIAFNLAPLWPLLFFIVLYLLIKIFIIDLKIYRTISKNSYAQSFALGTIGVFISFLISGLAEWNFGDQEIITIIWFTLGLNLANYFIDNEGNEQGESV